MLTSGAVVAGSSSRSRERSQPQLQTPDDALSWSRQLVNDNDSSEVIASASDSRALAESLEKLYKRGKGEGAMQLTDALVDGRDPLSVVVYPRDTLVGLYIL